MTALTTTQVGPQAIPGLQLLPGERLVREGAPSGVLRLLALLNVTLLGTIGVVTIPVLWWLALRSVEVHRYWLTDRRLVVRTGIIGYQVRSIPLSRVVDVSVRANWLDRLFGLTHVDVRDMTGESASQGPSRGAKLLAVGAPDVWAEDILTRAGGAPVGSDATELGELVAVLRQLVPRLA